MTLRRSPALAALALVSALALAGCGSSSSPGKSEKRAASGKQQDHVKVILDFIYNGSYGPLAYGTDKGFFADNGVDLEVIPGRGGDLAMQQINQGKVDFAFTDLSSYLRQKIQGQTDTTAVYVWVPDPQICIASLKPLSSPQDMAGKSFATVSFSNGRTTVPYVLKQNGVDTSKVDVRLLDISVLIPQLLSGAVDTAESAIPDSIAENKITAKKAGKDLSCTALSSWGYKDYGKMLIVRDALVKSDPDLVKRVVTAFDKSMQDAVANASADDIYQALKKVSPQTDQESIAAAWDGFKEMEQGNTGAIDPGFVTYSLEFLKNTEKLTTTASPDSLYDNSYIGSGQ
ncbi:MAG: ABC transporter substrate-binding protein [Nocardioidaceae bacterium]|nr:ABC transporter substrate-binding protein [Nocardioidaceae bacterium]